MNQRLKKLTHNDIEKTAKGLKPEHIGWAVEAAGKCFPVKQLVRAAANQLTSGEPQITTADSFDTTAAVRILRDNGFNPVNL